MVSEDFPSSRAFVAGSRVAGYLLEEQIGQGGMAVVFRAHDERLHRTVALKILAPGLAQDEVFRQRFMRESRAAVAVDDPHIIPVFDAGEASGVLFIAMRFVRGGDVRSLVQRSGRLPQGQAMEIISAVASALDAAHEAGLVHRDVKPANVLLDRRPGRSDHVYLSDFGLTKGALLATGLTETGQFLGTLDYTAPEQIGGKHVDGRADQYALACTAFELLSGEPPFHRADAMAVIYAQLSELPPQLTSRRPDLPAGVDAVFARALAKTPADRYRTCREFSEALLQALGTGRYDAGPSAWPQAGLPSAEVATSTAESPGQGSTASHFRDPYARPAEAGHQTGLRPPGPRPTGHVPARRSRRGALVLAGAGLAIVAAAAVIVSLTATGNGHGSAPGNSPRSATGKSPGSGGTLASGDSNGTTYLWDLSSQTPSLLPDPEAGSSGIQALSFSKDGSILATADRAGHAIVWNTATRTTYTTFTDPNTSGYGAVAVAMSPDGTELAVGDGNGTTYLWSLETRQPAGALADPNGSGVQAVAFSPDDSLLVTGDINGTTYVWQARCAISQAGKRSSAFEGSWQPMAGRGPVVGAAEPSIARRAFP